MNQDLSILHLVVNASFIVQLVMLVLLVGFGLVQSAHVHRPR